jgi:flagellar hook assembly protein FlgD
MDLSNNQLDDSVVVQALGVDDERQTVFGFRLASPSPVRGSVRFVCSVPGTAHLAARVYSTDGGLVRVLANRDVAAGRHEIAWDRRDESGTPVRPGRYLCRFEADGRGLVQPVTLIE